MKENNQEKLTDFGFEKIAESEKEAHVKEVFDEVAPKYDLMNDVLSFGLHRLWKRDAVNTAKVRPDMKVLDIAGGTGDMSLLIAPRLGKNGQLWLTDINHEMLKIGKQRLQKKGFQPEVCYCDAERLPFKEESFDLVIVAFGLRNMTHKDTALSEMYRVLKKGGRVLVLEFSKASRFLSPFYDFYSFKVMPFLASKITGRPENYRYLVESIRMHPNQQTLAKIMRSVGFEGVSWKNYSFGITALHSGYKN